MIEKAGLLLLLVVSTIMAVFAVEELIYSVGAYYVGLVMAAEAAFLYSLIKLLDR
jgi:hypothetical protein